MTRDKPLGGQLNRSAYGLAGLPRQIKVHCKIGKVLLKYVMATMRMKINLFPDPLLAEPYATLQSTIFRVELGIRKVILEGYIFKKNNIIRSQFM